MVAHVSKCDYCGTITDLPRKCKFCGLAHCHKHLLPENHECSGLEEWKRQRTRQPEDWITPQVKAPHTKKGGYKPYQDVKPSIDESPIKLGKHRREEYNGHKWGKNRNSGLPLLLLFVFIIVITYFAMSEGILLQKSEPLEIETTQTPVLTQIPVTTHPQETTPPLTSPSTTLPPTTQPPITSPPPTSPPRPILEVIEQSFRNDPNMKGVLEGSIKNNGRMTMTGVQMEAIFYDENETIVERRKGYPIGDLNPGETKSFIIRTNKLIYYLDHYELIIHSSEEITPPPTPELIISPPTTPPPTSSPSPTPPHQLLFNVAGGPTFDLIKMEKLVHNFINDVRLEHGLSPIDWNPELNLIARGHSEDMAERDYFEHISPEGEDFSDRYVKSGFYCYVPTSGNYYYTGGENLHQGWLYDSITYTTFLGVTTSSYDWLTEEDIAQQAVDGWMNSPGHRENILTPEWQTEGIGISVSDNFAVYVAENFC